ncbi:MAG: hypothetical protein HOC20_12585, partial [Chloroflexi bacterium]|nr:hypothetical protein [Chloroflexota bacterium]
MSGLRAGNILSGKYRYGTSPQVDSMVVRPGCGWFVRTTHINKEGTMKRVSGIGFILMAALLLALPLMAACGGDSETESESATTIPATSAKPEPATTIPATSAKPEGTLTIALSQLSVDPFLGPLGDGAVSNRTVWAYAFDFLVCAKSDGSGYAPWLAESWEIAPDGSSVTFHLRPGVQFHDGWG